MDEYEKRQMVEDIIQRLNEHHENAHLLDLTDDTNLPPGTRIRVASDDGNWIIVRIVENSTGKVLLTSGEVFAVEAGRISANKAIENAPVEARVIGSLVNGGPLPSRYGDLQVVEGTRLNPAISIQPHEILPLQIKHWHVLLYEVNGERRVLNGACAVEITLPSGTTFDLWREDS
jgi:hypothetical protein